jgi:hypothetical protein
LRDRKETWRRPSAKFGSKAIACAFKRGFSSVGAENRDAFRHFCTFTGNRLIDSATSDGRNAGNLGHRLGHFGRLMDELDVNIIAVSYRGYGASGGRSSERGLKRDADAALEFAIKNDDSFDKRAIFAYGHSLGAQSLSANSIKAAR